MVRLNQDLDDRHATEVNRVTAVEGQVALLHRDQVRSDRRVNVVVARAAELADAHTNERFVGYGFFFILVVILSALITVFFVFLFDFI